MTEKSSDFLTKGPEYQRVLKNLLATPPKSQSDVRADGSPFGSPRPGRPAVPDHDDKFIGHAFGSSIDVLAILIAVAGLVAAAADKASGLDYLAGAKVASVVYRRALRSLRCHGALGPCPANRLGAGAARGSDCGDGFVDRSD